ncbi:hypothetical protein RBY4I_3287 [Rhodobacterales bacterium Y4I]|nr:hypothetical protein RBY4I_3287 [Rhodobacterales bacterium Y4I]
MRQVVPGTVPGLPASVLFALARVIAVLLRQASRGLSCPIIPAPG